MSIDCRVFAIRETERNELESQPEWVLGRSLFAGTPLCDLRDAGRMIQVMLSGTEDEPEETATFLLTGGTELVVSHAAGCRPRLLDLTQVQVLNAQLERLSEVELQRRFHHHIWVSSILERIPAPSSAWESHDFRVAGCSAGDEDFAEEWSLDQADEYERISRQVEILKSFVSQAARQRQCLVIALQEAD